ncbi:MAG: carboxypeptidase regulatory-like protein [Caloramator sp.]|jgi:protocatechuate 3,4-dioxygenase beta subunit|uniref:MSCRAMM family protein n=1 Tax=Caloramator sp. TaxID=1871330 RepID=UPI001D4B3708|nr:carboxypeptidase-like regulatory domain-containing protein [Caloramator sp.]MBZ4664316.1 carboxypeptidase regulatory-like protein [Caloramator sp.]
MSNQVSDLYILGQSVAKELTGIGQEIRIDLDLQPNPNIDSGTIIGTIKDENGNPIPGAIIKIFDAQGNPIAHTFTDAQGNYTFSPFPPGTQYYISSIAPGFIFSPLQLFALQARQQLQIDITLTSDPKANLSIIAGDVFATTSEPIQDAIVQLFKVNQDQTETLIGTTFTNQTGQFLFMDIDQGTYKIRTSKFGYVSDTSTILIDANRMIGKLVITLNVDPNASKGTISGYIKDDNNQPIENAVVTLYRVEADGKLTPIKFTRTNAQGMYLFSDVPNGNYKVKANKLSV